MSQGGNDAPCFRDAETPPPCSQRAADEEVNTNLYESDEQWARLVGASELCSTMNDDDQQDQGELSDSYSDRSLALTPYHWHRTAAVAAHPLPQVRRISSTYRQDKI